MEWFKFAFMATLGYVVAGFLGALCIIAFISAVALVYSIYKKLIRNFKN